MLHLFLLVTLIQILYWLILFGRLALYKHQKPKKKKQEPVSIIICAHNEAANLSKNLPLILSQNYPNFEVIVVNDRSTDNSNVILSQFQQKYPHLRILNLEDFERTLKSKKYALSKGIDFAKHDLLLLTDADCYPISDKWLDEMQSHISDEITIGLGYSPYEKKAGWLNDFVRYETTLTAIQYLSYALWKMPYMGVGRNLTYRKELFYENDGFILHKDLISGDDDLLINQIATYNNISIIILPNTYVFSKSKKDWQGFYIQKSRHLSTSKRYKKKHILFLGIYSMSQFLYFGISCLLFVLQIKWSIFVSVFILRFVIMMLVSQPIFKKLEVQDLWIKLPILDFLYWLYLIRMIPTMFFSKSIQWK